MKIICLMAAIALLSCKTTTYYITRHAEKASGSMTTDPPLTAEGEKQAMNLKAYLSNKHIKAIYSTNFVRTRATAEPTRQLFGLELKLYTPSKNADLVTTLKNSNGNVLIVGHSNTVDDLVNGLTGRQQMSDLADNEYGDLFIVKKKGRKYLFERMEVPLAAD